MPTERPTSPICFEGCDPLQTFLPNSTEVTGASVGGGAQVVKVRLLLRQRGLGAVKVGTVDDYQGQVPRPKRPPEMS